MTHETRSWTEKPSDSAYEVTYRRPRAGGTHVFTTDLRVIVPAAPDHAWRRPYPLLRPRSVPARIPLPAPFPRSSGTCFTSQTFNSYPRRPFFLLCLRSSFPSSSPRPTATSTSNPTHTPTLAHKASLVRNSAGRVTPPFVTIRYFIRVGRSS